MLDVEEPLVQQLDGNREFGTNAQEQLIGFGFRSRTVLDAQIQRRVNIPASRVKER
ncbi:hypothetical protein [Trinickia soli]|uniref:hypothetical protein n=1 Tax=Trinickia soli TaxID=380675 RepID=UPI002AA541F1